MKDPTLNVITLSTELESALIQALKTTAAGSQLVLEANLLSLFFNALSKGHNYAVQEGFQRVAILCDPRIRRELRLLIENAYPRTPVLSYAEITPGYCVQNVHTLSL